MITAQVESFAHCAKELAELFPRHWAELALFKDRMPLVPQTLEYVDRNNRGRLLLVTVRLDGAIAAYYTVQVAPGFHYERTLTAHMDMCYVLPEHRNRGLAVPLFRAVERELRRLGVQVWYSGFKSHNPLGMPGFLDVLGFQLADEYRVKWIGT